MKNKKYEIGFSRTYTEEDLLDIISVGVYDIGYWALIDNTTEDWKRASESLPKNHTFEEVMLQLLKTGNCVVLEDVEDPDESWSLTMENLLNGIKLTIEKGHWNGDVDELDGELGDIIYQYALFNEIIFG